MNDSTVCAMFVIAVILQQYYRDEDIAYAFDLTEDDVREIFINYRLGIRKAVADALHILILTII